MQGLTLIKNCLFRFLAFVLLAVSAGFVVLPESNPYSIDKTFVKSHAPDNFVLVLTADDKEDRDEDGTIDIQLSPDFSVEFISLVSFTDSCKSNIRPSLKKKSYQAYIVYRQLLI
jgi:hypothetical protein